MLNSIYVFLIKSARDKSMHTKEVRERENCKKIIKFYVFIFSLMKSNRYFLKLICSKYYLKASWRPIFCNIIEFLTWFFHYCWMPVDKIFVNKFSNIFYFYLLIKKIFKIMFRTRLWPLHNKYGQKYIDDELIW